jgi:parvulin-like peptidyl-prolyl isomerase
MSIYKLRTEFGHHFKYILIGIAFIFVIGGIFTFAGMPGGGGKRGQEAGATDVVATVDGMPITKGEMDATWGQTTEALRDRGVRSTLQFAQQRAQVFQSLVERRVTLISAKAMGVEVSNSEVNAKRDQMVTDYLKQNRQRVLGKLDAEHDKMDPRNDSEYKAELSKGGMSLGQIEDQARTFISEGQISVQLAQDGIRKAVEQKAGVASNEDVKNSYNVYSVRQIMIFKGGMPAEQLQNQIGKIASEAKTGDFAALGKKYSQGPEKGGVKSVSYGMLSPEVWDQLGTMKAGEVSGPIDTDQAVYIVKVEGVTAKPPAKSDKKSELDRRKMIENMRQMQEYMKYDKQVRSKLDVQVTDPELAGYWHLSQLQRLMTNPVEAKKQLALAGSSLSKAVGKQPNNSFATAMLAAVLNQQGDTKHAMQLLYQLLEGKDSKGEGADLRIMLGDMLYKAGKKDEALKQYGKAAEAAGVDVAAHQQLIAKFKEIGRADLAANEQKWLTDYEAKKKIFEAQQRKSAPPGAPKPGEPVPGGGR